MTSFTEAPEVSLIVATLGRAEPLTRLLDSLAKQTSKHFEVIIVDQNPEGFLSPTIDAFRHRLLLVHVRSERGVSRARNAGLRVAQGKVVGFPDDDCWYDPGVVAQCIGIFASPSCPDGLTGICLDEHGEQSAGRFDPTGGPLTRQNVWRRANSTTTFCRKSVAETIQGFDESLGLGAGTRWGSGEETDFLLRAMDSGFSFIYVPEFVVRHPQISLPNLKDTRSRALPYARGFIRVMKKHNYSPFNLLREVVRPAVGALYFAAIGNWGRAALAYWTAIGRLRETLSFGQEA